MRIVFILLSKYWNGSLQGFLRSGEANIYLLPTRCSNKELKGNSEITRVNDYEMLTMSSEI